VTTTQGRLLVGKDRNMRMGIWRVEGGRKRKRKKGEEDEEGGPGFSGARIMGRYSTVALRELQERNSVNAGRARCKRVCQVMIDLTQKFRKR
jgi:hypothetical protein